MQSMCKEIGPEEIFAEMKMMRQGYDGALILLEGSTDISRFEKFIDEDSCSITNCFGRNNLIGAMRLAAENPVKGCVALTDSDFNRVLETLEELPNVIYSEHYDFDIDLIRTKATTRYLKVVADKEKYNSIGALEDVIEFIARSIAPVTYAKLANNMCGLGYDVATVEWYKFYSKFNVDLGRLISKILGKNNLTRENIERLSELINEAEKKKFDIWQITNGHDYCWALGVSLREDIGRRAKNLTTGKEIELHLRLTLDESDFKSLSVFQSLIEWQRRTKYVVLKSHLCDAEPTAMSTNAVGAQ